MGNGTTKEWIQQERSIHCQQGNQSRIYLVKGEHSNVFCLPPGYSEPGVSNLSYWSGGHSRLYTAWKEAFLFLIRMTFDYMLAGVSSFDFAHLVKKAVVHGGTVQDWWAMCKIFQVMKKYTRLLWPHMNYMTLQNFRFIITWLAIYQHSQKVSWWIKKKKKGSSLRNPLPVFAVHSAARTKWLQKKLAVTSVNILSLYKLWSSYWQSWQMHGSFQNRMLEGT